jgi:hypothetical protein
VQCRRQGVEVVEKLPLRVVGGSTGAVSRCGLGASLQVAVI